MTIPYVSLSYHLDFLFLPILRPPFTFLTVTIWRSVPYQPVSPVFPISPAQVPVLGVVLRDSGFYF